MANEIKDIYCGLELHSNPLTGVGGINGGTSEQLVCGDGSLIDKEQFPSRDEVQAKANDTDVVHKTGNECISGNKNFTDVFAENFNSNSATIATLLSLSITASSISKTGGTASQFLRADGSTATITYSDGVLSITM